MRGGDYRELGARLRADGHTTGQIIAQWRDDGLNPREAARLSHGMTQQQAADAWNALPDADPERPCTRKHISNWETTRQPSLDALNRLARVYRCSAGDLLGGEDYSHLDGRPQPVGVQPLSVAIAVVVRDDQVLLVRGKGGWQFPTGVVKPDQDAEDRAVDECAAETGIRCRPVRHLGGRVHPVSNAWCDYYLAEFLAGEPVNGQPQENSDVTWAPIARLGGFIPRDRIFGPVFAELEEHVQQDPIPEPVVATAVVTSELGVLLAARHDGKPPWTFPGGGIEDGEGPANAAVREVKEETGLAVTAVRELGRRVHPKTGVAMAYVLCQPVNGDRDVAVAPEEEDLSEVRWCDRAALDERIPAAHLFDAVREHLDSELPA